LSAAQEFSCAIPYARRERVLNWSLAVAVALVGFIIGFRFRAPALLAATLVIVLGAFASVWLLELRPARILQFGLLLLVIEHLAYGLGLALSVALQRR